MHTNVGHWRSRTWCGVKAAGFREAPAKTLPFAASDCIALAKSAFFDLHAAEQEEEEADLRRELRTASAALRIKAGSLFLSVLFVFWGDCLRQDI